MAKAEEAEVSITQESSERGVMNDVTVSPLVSVDHTRRFRPSSVALETLFILGRNYQPVDRYCLSTPGGGPFHPGKTRLIRAVRGRRPGKRRGRLTHGNGRIQGEME